jgi:two-component system sensor histidine kinase UhpB
MSLRYQINIRIFLASIAILILGGSVSIWQARNAVSKEVDSSLNLALQLVQLSFSQAQQGNLDIGDWLPRFVSLKQTRHLNIQLKKPDGEIAKFTAGQKHDADAEAPPEWFFDLVSRQYPEAIQQLITADGEQITLIIQADPLDEIAEVWEESCLFFISLLVMTLITFLAVNMAFNKAFKAIAVIVDALKAIELGQYQQKLPDFSIKEYDRIAKAINHMTHVLDATQKENRALTLHSLEIQEEERQRLSQELHDELGQSLTAIKVMAVTTKSNKAEVERIADAITGICDHLITVVRSMMRNLHPLSLTELGLKATLEDLFNQWTIRNPELKLHLNCSDDVDSLEQKITIQVFRIVQECITNIVRHAQAEQAVICLEIMSQATSGKQLRLQVTDNGRGCEPEQVKMGFGLLGMRERIKSLGGEFRLQAQPQQGMNIIATIPLI